MAPLRESRLFLTAALILAVAAGFYVAWPRAREVRAVRLQPAPIVLVLQATARVETTRVTLSALQPGRVVAVRAQEGELVEAGTPLVELARDEARAREAQAEAQLKEARAARRVLDQVQLDETREAVAQAQERLADAQAEADRLSALARSGAVARTRVEKAVHALSLRKSDLRSAQATLQAVQRGGARALSAQAAVERSQAVVELARAQLDQYAYTAPQPSRVAKRHVEVGDAVVIGSPLLELLSVDDLRLVADIDERNLAQLHAGQPALATLDAFPERVLKGTLRDIAPAVDETRGTVEVRFTLSDTPADLRPGMTASLEVQVAHKEGTLSVPSQAVHTDGAQPFVLIDQDNTAVRREVRLGLNDLQRAELLAGVEAGDTIIIDPEVSAEDAIRAQLTEAESGDAP